MKKLILYINHTLIMLQKGRLHKATSWLQRATNVTLIVYAVHLVSTFQRKMPLHNVVLTKNNKNTKEIKSPKLTCTRQAVTKYSTPKCNVLYSFGTKLRKKTVSTATYLSIKYFRCHNLNILHTVHYEMHLGMKMKRLIKTDYRNNLKNQFSCVNDNDIIHTKPNYS